MVTEPVDLAGRKIGRLIALRPDEPDPSGHPNWRCRCVCGTEFTKRQWVLLNQKGHLSCGCMRAEYSTWRGMIYRCSGNDRANYIAYYAAGVRVCQRWLDSFDAFYEDMGPRPGPEYSIDREDVEGNYEPGNCRWATPDVQHANVRRSITDYEHLVRDGLRRLKQQQQEAA